MPRSRRTRAQASSGMGAFPLCKAHARVVASALQGLLLHFAVSILAVQGLQGFKALLIYIGEKKDTRVFFSRA